MVFHIFVTKRDTDVALHFIVSVILYEVTCLKCEQGVDRPHCVCQSHVSWTYFSPKDAEIRPQKLKIRQYSQFSSQ